MPKPHRATPEQWETIEKYADTSAPYSCFLELRARIEALEAAQQPYQDKMGQLIAIDRDDPGNSPIERIATDISPAAQAIMVAATNGNINVVNDPVYKQCIAAALRAAADQCKIEWNYHPDYPETESVVVVSELLAIAAELEGSND